VTAGALWSAVTWVLRAMVWWMKVKKVKEKQKQKIEVPTQMEKSRSTWR
jgi:hypothetical protein